MLRMNFFKTALASMLVVCATAFYSCESDGEEPETPPADESSIVGKWEVTNPETRAAGDAKYGSFEFTADNKYIITQPTTTTSGEKALLVIFGDYVTGDSKDNELTLDLKEFGVITIAVNKTSATITVNGVTYVAVKAKEVNLSDKTKLLCGTWKESHCIDAEGVRWDNDDPGYRLVFTESGTYYFQETDEFEENGYYISYGTWQFKNDDMILVDYNENSDETGNIISNGIKIVKLTEKEFVFIEDEGTEEEYTTYLYR